MIYISAFLILLGTSAIAESILVSKTIHAGTIITKRHIVLKEVSIEGVYSDPSQVIGLRSNEILYSGQPILYGQLSEAILISRNEVIRLFAYYGNISIEVQGRALRAGSKNEIIEVMNLESRKILSAKVTDLGVAQVNIQQ